MARNKRVQRSFQTVPTREQRVVVLVCAVLLLLVILSYRFAAVSLVIKCILSDACSIYNAIRWLAYWLLG